LGKRLEERFLRGFFSLAAIPEKSMRDMEDPVTVTADNFRKSRLVVRACLARQLEIGRLFVSVRQKRSSIESGGVAQTLVCVFRLVTD